MKAIKKQLDIAMVSDLHAKEWPDFKPADVLIFAGDFTNASHSNMFSQVLEFNKAMEGLKEQSHKFRQIVITFGNHDTFAKHDPNHPEIIKWERVFRENGTRLDFLVNKMIKFEDVTFYGNPYNKPHSENSPWAFHWDEKKQAKTFSLLRSVKPDVIVTHAPPYGINDQDRKGEHAGDERWFQYLDDYRPKLWVFGHIHESYGMKTINSGDYETTYVNAALTKSHYHEDDGTVNPVQYFTLNYEVVDKDSMFPFTHNQSVYNKVGNKFTKNDKTISGEEFGNAYKEYKNENRL